MKELYSVIFKRKSMRKFPAALSLTEVELAEIQNAVTGLTPLISDIKTDLKIVNRDQTTSKYGSHCLLLYSEQKPHYLMNAGYLLEQLDLLLQSRDIGVCWYGMAKVKQPPSDGLSFVIMLAFGKSQPGDFRKSPSEFSRKSADKIWNGSFDPDVMDAVRLAPSACNTQPWRIVSDAKQIKVFRNTKIKSIIPMKSLSYFNSIDMGICLCFLETALEYKGHAFTRELPPEEPTGTELLKLATYTIE